MERLLEEFPEARWHQYEPLNDDARWEGARLAFGKPLDPVFHFDRADTVLVIGGGAPGDTTTEAEAGRDYLVAEGVPTDAVAPIARGSTTLESLQATARWMRQHELTSAFLVSDPWHNLRIRKMASDLGIEAYASATWQSAATSERTRLPGYVRETFAYLYYRVFGR